MSWVSVLPGILSAVAGLVGVVVGGRIARRIQMAQYSTAEETAACAALLRAYSAVYIQLAIASANDRAPASLTSSTWVEWEPWEGALAVIDIVCSVPIVEAAHTLDAAFWRASVALRAGHIDTSTWPEFRSRLEADRLHFVNTVRREVGPRKAHLAKLSGRPIEDNTI